MARGPKKHLKRLYAPKHWMLAKLGGVFAPKPSAGPHKSRECLPLIILIRNRLKYALTRREVGMVLAQRLVKVDGKVRSDMNFPAGFMDTITIERSNDYFRLLYDVKGRFAIHRIKPEEAKYKLCKVTAKRITDGSVPVISTHDGRTIRYPDPLIKVNDTVKIDLATGKITDFVKFETGNQVMITGGHNIGRVGVIVHRERHPGSFDIVKIRDATGATFSTRIGNVFVIGKGEKSLVSLPRNRGIRISVIEDREKRLAGKH
eukprot:GEZU01038852.1.p2 GENE.GEZU01038852.1~~GEZU01038852.1.p2  ORF type:complete len:261 (+),score=98.33 GEZU01038852.1:44-826(+)